MNPEDVATVKANVQKLIDAGAPDQDIHDYIEAAGHPLAGPATHGTPLQGQMGHPIVDASPEQPTNSADISEPVARHILNAAQGIPGMETLQALMGSLGSKIAGSPLTPDQSLNTLRGETAKIGGVDSALEKAAGGSLLLPFLPANPALAGALYGGADAALSPDHLGSPTATALGAAGGALLGKVADVGVTAARGLLATSPATNLLERAAARAASAKRLYGAAMAEGQGKAATPAIQSYLAEPDVAEIVSELQGTREFKGVAPESPEMLDAIYKTLSDRAATVKKGLMSVNPNRPNIGRFQAKDLAAAQQAGLTAMDETMPTYREAVKDFAKHKAAEDAVSRGYEAVRGKMAQNLPTARNLTRTTPEAFSQWAERAGPDETKAAVEGILGGVKKAMLKAPLTKGRKAVFAGGSLLRAAGDATSQYLPRAGLLAAIGSQ